MKRALDLIASVLGLLILGPVLALVALAIRVCDGAPVFFGQMRVGQNGRPFRMWKFRSMRVSNTGPAITVGGDARITPIGRVLRKTKLDEFPQLWNVLKGEMSLVGPRPEVERYTRLYPPALQPVLRLKPGITDPASFAAYDEEQMLARAADPEQYYVSTLMPEKIRINLEYAERRSLASDVLVIVATVAKPLGVHVNIFARLRLTPPSF